MVSVVITTLNEVRTIRDCIISILNQNYPNFEILIIDAKSTDGTFENAAELRRLSSTFTNCKRFLLLSEDANSPAKGRNIGASLAKGSILAFTDGDCIAHEEWLLNLVNYIPKGMGIVGGPNLLKHFKRTRTIDAIDNVLGTYLGSGGSPQFWRIKNVSEIYPIPSCNMAIQKSLFDAVRGFDEKLRYNEDTDFNKRVHERGFKIIYTPYAVINHFMGLDSYSQFSRLIFKYSAMRGQNASRDTRLIPKFAVISAAILIGVFSLISLAFTDHTAFVVLLVSIPVFASFLWLYSMKSGVQNCLITSFLSVPIFITIFVIYNAGFSSSYLTSIIKH